MVTMVKQQEIKQSENKWSSSMQI